MALAGPSGFGIVGTYVVHEPVRTIVFAACKCRLYHPRTWLIDSRSRRSYRSSYWYFTRWCGSSHQRVSSVGSRNHCQLIISPRNWSFLFYVLAGLGAIPLVLGWFAMPWDRKAFTGSKVPRMDWIGGLLVTSGLSLFMFSLTQSGVLERGWSEPCKPSPFLYFQPDE
jgi:hypothetical protein